MSKYQFKNFSRFKTLKIISILEGRFDLQNIFLLKIWVLLFPSISIKRDNHFEYRVLRILLGNYKMFLILYAFEIGQFVYFDLLC